jgi:hypothetical protein
MNVSYSLKENTLFRKEREKVKDKEKNRINH